jgi:uncharacterized DUF497 family protein
VAFFRVIWDLDDDPRGNVRHIAEHGITKAEVLEVLNRPVTYATSRSSGRPVAIGTTMAGRTILVVYEGVDDDTAYPITAYELVD